MLKPNTCGMCVYLGSCTTMHKSLTSSNQKCQYYEELPVSTKVPELWAQIQELSFVEQNQLRKLLNQHILGFAQEGLKSGQIVGFSIGDTKGWVSGKIIGFDDGKTKIQDEKGRIWHVWPGYIDVFLGEPEKTSV